MLHIENAIRVDEYLPKSRVLSGRTPIRTYIFQCVCGKEVKSRNSYLKRHSGKCRKCNGKEILKTKAIPVIRLRPYESIYNYLKSQDKKCDISYEDFVGFAGITECHYCGENITWKEHGQASTINLDRKDNRLPHIKENLVVCCGDCNRTKGDRFSYEEFMLLSPVLKQIRRSRQ